MGFLKLDPDLWSQHRRIEGSFRIGRKGTGLGCLRKRHFHLQRGWSDVAIHIKTIGNSNNQYQVPSVIAPRTSWMTHSRTRCDHLDFRTSGNTSRRTMNHQVQV